MRQSVKLFNVGCELTTACPCRCVTCGSDAGVCRKGELSTEEWLALVRAASRLGAKRLCLLGGEPLIHPGWSSIAALGTELGLDVDLVTCGLGIDDKKLDDIKQSGVVWITISIDGTEAAHDRCRRMPGGFRESLDAIRRLDEAGLKVGVTTQINRWTLPTLDVLAEQLETAGAMGWQLQLTIASGRARHVPDLVITPAEMPDVLSVIRRLQRRRGLRPYITDSIGYMTRDDPALRSTAMCPERCWCGCFAGLRAVGITSRGDVKGCLSLTDDFVEGNLREESLEAIWGDPRRFVYNRSYHPSALSAGCADCQLSAVCRGGCTSVSVTATGKPNQGPYCLRLQGVT